MLKQIAMVGGALFLVGAIGMGVSAARGHDITINGNPVSWLNIRSIALGAGTPIHAEKDVSAKTVNHVTVDADVAVVEVLPGSTNQATAVLSGRSTIPLKDYNLTATVSGSKLNVSLSRVPSAAHMSGTQNIHLTVTLPKHTYQGLKIHTDVGKVDVHDLTSKGMTLHVQSGAISVGHVNGPVTATTNVGKVDVTDATGPLHVTANTGAINVSVEQLTHNIDATTNTGAVNITSSKVPTNLSVHLQANLGQVSADIPGLQYKENKRTLIEGAVGTGKPQVTATSNIGSVTLN